MQALTVTNTYISVRGCYSPEPRSPAPIHSIGYYVHTCKKMKYKSEYSPSYLLDPVRHVSPIFVLFFDGM